MPDDWTQPAGGQCEVLASWPLSFFLIAVSMGVSIITLLEMRKQTQRSEVAYSRLLW